jgi:hypothetical protein
MYTVLQTNKHFNKQWEMLRTRNLFNAKQPYTPSPLGYLEMVHNRSLCFNFKLFYPQCYFSFQHNSYE